MSLWGLAWPQELETKVHMRQVPREDQQEGFNTRSIVNKHLPSVHYVPGTVLAAGDTAVTALALGRLHSSWRDGQSINKSSAKRQPVKQLPSADAMPTGNGCLCDQVTENEGQQAARSLGDVVETSAESPFPPEACKGHLAGHHQSPELVPATKK